MANTGYKLPRSAVSSSESPYNNADGAWNTPENIYGAGTANITNNSWDSGELSHILKGYNFDLSAIPTNATINGVICRIVCSCTASATMNITLAQLLDVSQAKVGTNMASTPIAITPQAGATLSIGANNNNWGNSLTGAWVRDADFGVAIGVTSGTNNADVYIDSVELDVYYTDNNINVSPSTGALTITGYAPTVAATQNQNVSPSTGKLVITGYAPTVFASKEVTPATGELVITGYAPTVVVAEVPTFISGIKSLKYSLDGSPWARLATKAGLGVNTLQYSLDGSPWWGVEPSASTWTAYPLKYYTGGTWTTKPLKWHNGSIWVEKDLKKL